MVKRAKLLKEGRIRRAGSGMMGNDRL